jgi:TonB family protein
MRVQLTTLLLCFLVDGVAASGQDAEAALKQFEGKILILRHPLQSDSQRYDAEGKVLKGGSEGPWTVYGGVLIEQVVVAPSKLQFTGQRILFLFKDQRFTLLKFQRLDDMRTPPFSPSMKMEITLNEPVNSAEQARAILNRVFALNTSDVLDSVSDFWRDLLKDSLIYDPLQKQEEEFHWRQVTTRPKPDDNSERGTISDNKVFRLGKEVKAPKPQYTPEPQFSEIARYERFQGTNVVNLIVDKTGAVQSIKLVRPLGLGLDDSARATIQKWRFHPGTRNGEPVAVELNVETGFHLY